jgi:putative membrane protein insertion efficiency factor
MRRRGKIVLWSLLGLTVYLTGESFLPPSAQPTAQGGIALIHAYQATGSRVMESSGVHCRYTPTCSHYAEDAIAYYGTVGGVARAAGRLWRCSPWGGSGYDPAVDEHAAAYVAPQQEQETPEQRKQREEAMKAAEEFRKSMQQLSKDMPKDAGKAAAACGLGCVTTILFGLVSLAVHVFLIVWVFKDATARGDPNAVLWPILSFFFPLVGLIVYLAVRPKGDMSPCGACHKQRLSTLTVCPHCKNGGASAPPAAPATPA